MRLAELAFLFGLAWAIPYTIRHFENRIGARAQAVLYAGSLAAVASATFAILLVAMAPEALSAENLIEVFRACFGALRTLVSHPVAHVPALLAAGLVGGLVARTAFAAARLGIAAFRATREAQRLVDAKGARLVPALWRRGVVVTSQEESLAYVAGLFNPVVVVSTGLLISLQEDERAAAVAHELGHRRLHHNWYMLAASVIGRGLSPLPPVRAGVRGLRRALEARADEVAVNLVGVDSLARAIGKAALGPARPSVLALGDSDTVWRVKRLLAPHRPTRLLAAALILGVASVLVSTQMIAVARASSLVASVQFAGHHCRLPESIPPPV